MPGVFTFKETYMFEYTLFYMPNGSILLGITLFSSPTHVLLPAIWSKDRDMYPLPGALECMVTTGSYSLKAEMADDALKQEYCAHLSQDLEEYPEITDLLLTVMGKDTFEDFKQNLEAYVLGSPVVEGHDIDLIDGEDVS